MAAVRTYGIPRMVEAREIFLFNKGIGKLRIRFSGGIPDPKYQIPATYSTADPFEQLVIEHSKQFGNTVFRYDANGNIINSAPFEPEVDKTPAEPKLDKRRRVAPSVDDTKSYPLVETLGDATEVLLELGVPASELNGQEAVIAAMVRCKVSFPNLKLTK